MKLIVGLGNPGEKYERTRHNLGFMVVEKFFKDYASVEDTIWREEKKLKSYLAQVQWQPKEGTMEKVILAKPQTYMNNSGMAVRLISDFYKISTEDIWVAYDDLDLPVGTMKIRLGGAAGGHKGVESILAHLESDKFWRFRFGIGLPHGHSASKMPEEGTERVQARRRISDVENYVLGDFGSQDRNKVREMIKYGSQALQVALEKGLGTAQNRFNTK